MDRRTFIKGTLATAALAAGPFGAPPQGLDPAWVADGDGWRQVSSLLAIKKGDIFVISWPIRYKAMADGMGTLPNRRKVFSFVRGALRHTERAAGKMRWWLRKYGQPIR